MNALEKYKNDSIVVGLSGGADSVALFFALREAGARVFAAHVNHGLRGDESECDEKFVRDLCRDGGVELRVFRADVRELAAARKLGIEEAARILRYEFLETARTDFGAAKIAVGHNADDNAETVLMNLARGAGLRGLGGIPPVSACGTIIRPLLDVSRAEIEAYLRERGIGFLTDSSNASDEFTRNRVRNKIIPAIESAINPNARAAIARTAELLRMDEDFLQGAARAAFAEIAGGGTGISPPRPELKAKARRGYSRPPLRLCAAGLAALHPAIGGRVVRVAISEVRGGESDVTHAHVSAVLDLAQGEAGREVHLPGVVAVKEYDVLVFSAVANAGSESFCYELIPDTPVFIPEIGKIFTLSHDHPYPTPVFLRTRRAGDKITLKRHGKFFTKKLQDYFTDEKIPRRQRDKIPLLAHEDEILWIMDKKGRVNARFDGGEKNITISFV